MSSELQCLLAGLFVLAAPLALRVVASGRSGRVASPWLPPSTAKTRLTALQVGAVCAATAALVALLAWRPVAGWWAGSAALPPGLGPDPVVPPEALRLGAASAVSLVFVAYGAEAWLAWFRDPP